MVRLIKSIKLKKRSPKKSKVRRKIRGLQLLGGLIDIYRQK